MRKPGRCWGASIRSATRSNGGDSKEFRFETTSCTVCVRTNVFTSTLNVEQPNVMCVFQMNRPANGSCQVLRYIQRAKQ